MRPFRASFFESRRRTGLAMAAICALLSIGFGCNDHPVETVSAEGAVEYRIVDDTAETTKLDLLWVIDNSGSMCEEQEELREQFPAFVKSLRRYPIDFHVAVTTTDVVTKTSCESPNQVQSGRARFDGGAGCLQSRPRPVTGTHSPCRYRKEKGTLHDGREGRPGPDYAPIRNQLEQAVKCTKAPSNWSHLESSSLDKNLLLCAESRGNNTTACSAAPRPTDHIECELDGTTSACDASGRPHNGVFELRDLFPPPSAYRSLGETPALRASDYESSDGSLRIDELRRDFACMSFVGTRGDGYEQGLRALVRAVSPERTGGPADVEEPRNPNAPNHGFIRKDVRFGAIFVTDENDCTNDANLSGTRDSCAGARCYFPNRQGPDESPMTDLDELREQFRKNLAASKGVESVPGDEILLGVVHGGYLPFQEATERPKSCRAWVDAEASRRIMDVVPRTCATDFGEARSGDRYEEFLVEFENYFPERVDVSGSPGEHIPGQLCRGKLRRTFEEMGRFFSPQRRVCIRRELPSCDTADACPSATYDSGVPACANYPAGDGGFCRTTMQARLTAGAELDRPERRLEKTGFCIEESLESSSGTAECVVRPTLYRWVACPGGGDGISFEWKEPSETGGKTRQISRKLADVELRLRYVAISGSSGSGAGDE